MAGSPLASLANSMLSGTDMQAFKMSQVPDTPTGTDKSGTDQVASSPLSQQQQQSAPMVAPANADMGSGDTADTSQMSYAAPRGPNPDQINREQVAIDSATMRNSDPNEGYNDPYNNEGDAGGGGRVIDDQVEFGAPSTAGGQAGGYAQGGVVKAIPDKATKRKIKKVKKFAGGGPTDDEADPEQYSYMNAPKNTDPSLLATRGEVDREYKDKAPDDSWGKNPRQRAQNVHASKDLYKTPGGMSMLEDRDQYAQSHRQSDNVEYAGQPDRASWWTAASAGIPTTNPIGSASGTKMAKEAGIDDVPGYASGGMVAPSIPQIGAKGSAGGPGSHDIVQPGTFGGISSQYWGHGGRGGAGGGGGGGGFHVAGDSPSKADDAYRLASLQRQSASDSAAMGAYASMYHADTAAQASVNQARIHEDAANLRQSMGEDAALYGSGAAQRASQERMANTSTTTEPNPDGGNTVTRTTGAAPAGTTGNFPLDSPGLQKKRRTADGGMDDSTQMADAGDMGGMPPPSIEAAEGGPIPEIAPDEAQNVPTEASQGSTAAPAGPPEQGDDRGGPGEGGPPSYIDKAKMYAQEGLYEGHRHLMPQGIQENPEGRKMKVMDHLSRKNADPYLGAALEAARKEDPDNPYWANVDKVVSNMGDASMKKKADDQGNHALYGTIQALAQKYMGNVAHATVNADKGDWEKAVAFANNASDYVAGQNLTRYKLNAEGVTATVVDKKTGEPVMEKNLSQDQFLSTLGVNFDEVAHTGPERVLDRVEKGAGKRLGGPRNTSAGGSDQGKSLASQLPQGVRDWASGVNQSKGMQAPGQDATGEAQLQPSGGAAAPGYGGSATPPPGPNDMQGGASPGATPVRTAGQQQAPGALQGGAEPGARPVQTQGGGPRQLPMPPQEGGGAAPPMQGIPTQPRAPGTYPLPFGETDQHPYGPAQMATVPQGRDPRTGKVNQSVTGMVAGHGGQDREYQMTPRTEQTRQGMGAGPARLVVGGQQGGGTQSADRGIPTSLPRGKFSNSPQPEPSGDDRIVSTQRAPRIIRGGKVEEMGQPPVNKRYGDLNPTQKQLYDILGPEHVVNGRTGETNWSKHLDEAATQTMGGKKDPAGTRASSQLQHDADVAANKRIADEAPKDKAARDAIYKEEYARRHLPPPGSSSSNAVDNSGRVARLPGKNGNPAMLWSQKLNDWVPENKYLESLAGGQED